MLKSIAKLFTPLFGNSSFAGGNFHPTQTCPECGSRLGDGGSCNSPLRGEDVLRSEDAVWRCPNPDCPVQVRARMEHWCSREVMDIAGGDAALITKLVGAGLVRDVAELYRLKVAEIAALTGMDRSSAQKFFDAIAGSRQREGWRLLFGLDIPGVSAAEAQSLCRHFGSVDAVFAASVERLQAAEEVSLEAAQNINRWHSDGVNRRLVKRLFKAGLNFKVI